MGWFGKNIDLMPFTLPWGMEDWGAESDPGTNFFNKPEGTFHWKFWKKVQPGDRGMLTGYYGGPDEELGFKKNVQEFTNTAREGLSDWESGFEGGTTSSPYGMFEGETFDVAFDPTSVESIAEALARKQFMRMVGEDIDTVTGASIAEDVDSGEGLFHYASQHSDIGGDVQKGRYGQLGSEDIEDYWQDWFENLKADEAEWDLFKKPAEMAAISRGELAGLSPGASEWRNMLKFGQEEAGDTYRSVLDKLHASTGGLDTGSLREKRKDLRDVYHERMLDVKSGISGERSKRIKGYEDKIRKIFGTV